MDNQPHHDGDTVEFETDLDKCRKEVLQLRIAYMQLYNHYMDLDNYMQKQQAKWEEGS